MNIPKGHADLCYDCDNNLNQHRRLKMAKQKTVKKVNGTLVKSNVLTQKPGYMYFVKEGNVYALKMTGMRKK